MALGCLKYSLAFLLGAMTLGMFLILQLQRDIVRVEIHWNDGSSETLSAVDHPAEVVAATFSDLAGGGGGDSAAASKMVGSLDSKLPSHKKDVSQMLKQLQKPGLLFRQARQLSQDQSPVHSYRESSSSSVVESPQPKNTSKLNINKPDQESVRLIEEALSQTAPDWVGSTLPPALNLQITKCSDEFCLDNLSELERHQFETCKQRTSDKEHKIGPILPNASCRFQNGTSRHPVALASFPGSGNTWMRGLLQKTTGICTGNLMSLITY